MITSKNKYIEEVCSKIKSKYLKKEIANELDTHITENMKEKMKQGLTKEEAEKESISSMGNAEDIANQINDVHKSKFDIKSFAILLLIIVIGIIINVQLYKSQGQNLSTTIYDYVFINIVGVSIGVIGYFISYKLFEKLNIVLYILASLISLIPIILKINIPGTTLISALLYVLWFSKFVYYKNNTTFSEILKSFLILISLIILTFSNSFLVAISLLLAYISIYFCNLNKFSHKSIVIGLSTNFILIALFTYVLLMFGSPYRLELIKNAVPTIDNVQANNFINDYQNSQMLSYALNNYNLIFFITILITYFLLIFLVIKNIKKIKEIYGKNITIGLITIILFQAIICILSNLAIIPRLYSSIYLISFNGIESIFFLVSMSIIMCIYKEKDYYSSYCKNNIE